MKRAKWIWLNQEAKSDEYAVFQDTFNVDKTNDTVLKISALGDYNVYVNGEFVAFGQYADYAHYKVYDEVDISSYLKTGENTLLIVAWYIGKSFSTYKDFGAGLLFEITSSTGEVLSWSRAGMRSSIANGYVSHLNKQITLQLGYSYRYDARITDYVWGEAVEVKEFGTELIKRPNKKLELSDFMPAKLIDGEKRLYDLGRESCGFLDIQFKAESGEKIVVAYGEHIVDGGVRAYIDGRDFTVELIGNGEWVAFLGSFRRLGCRYLQIFGNAEIERIGLRETNYPLEIKPYSIADERRRKIYEISLRTLSLCMHEHYEDCPWREQSMYIMDSRNQMLCGYYGFNNPEFALSAIRLMAQGQKENGLFELCFPADVPITIPSFSLAYTTVVLEYTQFTRDTSLAKEVFSNMEKMLNYFITRLDGDGLFKTVSEEGIWHFYEWIPVLDGAFFELDGSKKIRNEYDSLINAFLSISLGNMATICSLLQDYDKTFYYNDLKLKCNQSIKKTFFVSETGLFKTHSDRDGYSELANALCVLADVCTAEEANVIAEKLAFGYDGWDRNTLSMSIFRYDALLKTDKETYADIVLKDIDETYGFMLDHGATSFWETIKGEADFHFAGSLCHGWSALPVYYYHILGVCKERKEPINQAFQFYDIPSRTEYAASILQYVNDVSASCEKERNVILELPEEERRQRLEKTLGLPLGHTWEKTVLLKKQLLLKEEGIQSTRYTFLLNGKIPFSGILYENLEKTSEKEGLIFALAGGGGTSEIVGDLFVHSSNYNHMVRRVLKPGIKVFAPQLLLWNKEIYGSDNDRGWLNHRLIQMGGSITAFEVQCLKRTLDWWLENEQTDAEKVGVIGLSYGGMYALHFGALDPRIRCTYSSCWFSDRRKHNWHDWTYFNAERTFFDAEVASLVLPRKLYIEVAIDDEVFPAIDAKKERERLEKYAKDKGLFAHLHYKEFEGKHELDTDERLIQEFVKEVIS